MAARWHAATGDQWSIASGRYRATIVEVGGGIRTLERDGAAVVDGYPEENLPRQGAGQVLAPWPNRIGDGAYELDGQRRQLPINEISKNNAIHGLVRWVAWRRLDHTPESVTVGCTLAPHPGYPRALELVTKYTLSSDGLRVDHTAANLGNLPAPFGLGTHPYVRVGDTPVSSLLLSLPADTHLVVDERMLPARTRPVGGRYDFHEPRQIADMVFDTAYTDLHRDDDGVARVRITENDGSGAEVWLGQAFRWVQVYNGGSPNGTPGASLAVEPTSCPPDAFRTGVDVVTLDGGARWQGSWGIRALP